MYTKFTSSGSMWFITRFIHVKWTICFPRSLLQSPGSPHPMAHRDDVVVPPAAFELYRVSQFILDPPQPNYPLIKSTNLPIPPYYIALTLVS